MIVMTSCAPSVGAWVREHIKGSTPVMLSTRTKWQSEARQERQNFAERGWKDSNKSWTNNMLNISGAPSECWLLVLLYVCYLQNHIAYNSLGWRTPVEWLPVFQKARKSGVDLGWEMDDWHNSDTTLLWAFLTSAMAAKHL